MGESPTFPAFGISYIPFIPRRCKMVNQQAKVPEIMDNVREEFTLMMVGPTEIHDFLMMFVDFLKEAPVYRTQPIVPECVIRYVMESFENKDRFLIIAYKDHIPAGLWVGQKADYLFNNTCFAFEHGAYVRPMFRKTKLATQMGLAFRDWAKNNGCSVAQLALTGSNGDEYLKTFNMKEVGRLYQMEL